MTKYLDPETPEVSNLVVHTRIRKGTYNVFVETKFTSKWHNILAKDSRPNNIIPRSTKIIAKITKSLDAEGLQMKIRVLWLLLGPHSAQENVVIPFFQKWTKPPDNNLFKIYRSGTLKSDNLVHRFTLPHNPVKKCRTGLKVKRCCLF